MRSGRTPKPEPAFGVYVHIPFCVAKCGYCDFASVPLARGALEPYLDALVREIDAAPERGRAAATVFFGGGTPSLLAGAQIGRLLAALRATFAVAPDAEITLEANPGTIDAEKAAAWRAHGITRVSLGVQSLDDALLARLGRRHSAHEALAAFELLRREGFANIGLDLIHGLPGQTPALWRRDLARAIALGPEHLSLYALGIEEGTPFAAELRAGRLALPAEEEALEMHAAAAELTARAGYERYEISNWSRPGMRCRHNADCWSLGEYRGFGAAAHSFLCRPRPVRRANERDPAAYVRLIRERGGAVASSEEPAPRQFAGEAAMLALRTVDGLDEAAFAAEHGAGWDALFPEAAALGAARGWIARAAGRARLTAEGMLFSDALFRLLF
ncbi:MAG TPA: radical SAM family heme chaperone HemW [bacterium]